MEARELLGRDRRRSGSAIARANHLAAALFVLLALALVAVPANASASPISENAVATHAYLLAKYKLARALVHQAHAARGAQSAAAAQISRECRGVLSGMPQPSLKLAPTPRPRARGENARLTRQQETIEVELATASVDPLDNLYRPAEEAYAAEVRQLSWSSPVIASLVQTAAVAKLEEVSAPALSFCADARAWVQSGYRALSAASREFEASRTARKSYTLGDEGSLSTLLEPYENTSDRALVRKTKAAEHKLLANLGTAIQTFTRLRRIVGLPHAGAEEPKKQVTLGRGRTAAGTRFVVDSETSGGILGSLGSGGSCHRSASVFYTRPGSSPEELVQGGPNNPICLSPPQVRHPALFCEEGIETIQTAVPASVSSAKLVLADGHTIESRVIRVPPRDGGPAGIYAQEIRGTASHAVSLVELNASDEVVLTLDLPRYHCVKRREEREFPFSVVKLVTGDAPEGEPFTISAFGNINGEPFLSVDTGVNPQINEPTVGPQAPKTFPWSLSIGCAPHPYTILYGILAPPGKSVTARTPEGTVALNVIPIEPRVHAKGPLVYGVFSALPFELTVIGTNGSPLYTESLQAQAMEAAQFCEGYAEPPPS
jgi:hypothetical protein